MPAPRRMLALVLVALLAPLGLAACGADDDPAAATGATATTSTGAAVDATTATNGRRRVVHALGATRLDGTPRRVVALGLAELELATTLGVRPVGTVALGRGAGVSDELAARARGIPTVGTSAAPDLDAIARLRPDLILGSARQHAGRYERLRAIAPTVLTGRPSAWRRTILTQATALGKLPQAQEMLDDYRRRARLAGRHLRSADSRSVLAELERRLPRAG